MLGRHREFNQNALGAIGADAIEWYDFPSGEIRRDKKGNIILGSGMRTFGFYAPR
jgi:hypothetical protein